jgi:hypothetical protein
MSLLYLSKQLRPLRAGPFLAQIYWSQDFENEIGGYGAGTGVIMGAVAPVIMAVLAAPVWIMFFNV